MIRNKNTLSLKADGFVGAVELHLSYSADIQLTLTNDAMVADFITTGNQSTVIIVAPEDEFLLSANQDFTVDDIRAASGKGFLDVEVVSSFALVNGHNTAGSYSLTWDGSRYASGVYILYLKGDDFQYSRKRMLLK